MNFKQLFAEERAVSPVIGVILMVAITVILAAVIGTFVLGLGDQVSESAPQAQFTFDYDGTTLTVTHDGGDSIAAGELSIAASDTIEKGNSTAYGATTGTNVALDADSTFASTASISAGTTIYVQAAGTNSDLSDDVVRLVWSSPNSDKTATIGKWEA